MKATRRDVGCGSPRWRKLPVIICVSPAGRANVVTAIARITRGNFRLVERLFAQIQRVVQINNLPAITPEVVAVASESLVIGSL